MSRRETTGGARFGESRSFGGLCPCLLLLTWRGGSEGSCPVHSAFERSGLEPASEAGKLYSGSRLHGINPYSGVMRGPDPRIFFED
jgi:hypothetical protein